MRQIYLLIKAAVFTFSLLIISTQHSSGQMAISYGTPLVTGLVNAVDVVNAGDTRLFIAQQNGLIRIYDGTTTLTTFMDLSGQGLFPNPLGSEQGLLSIAFHPQFATNRYFFIWYTAWDGAVTLARYRANAGLATGDPASGVILFSVAKPGTPYFTNHNGGKLNFGADGMLYIGLGDGGNGGDPFNNAQNVTSLLGKMLRLDVSDFAIGAPYYTIPADNPFLAAGDGIRDEIFALGLRNPWRWSFDRANGSMWIADVGQGNYEEVNYRTASGSSGINYGWRCREGKHDYNTSGCGSLTLTEPIFEYDHTLGQSITGGYVYRGPDAGNAALLGTYICTDFVSGRIWLLQPDGSFILQTVNTVSNISGFGESSNGTLYAIRRAANGGLYKINLLNTTPVSITNLSGTHAAAYNTLTWSAGSEVNTAKYMVEYSVNGNDFTTAGEVTAMGNSGSGDYTFRHDIVMNNTGYYRLKIIDNSGAFKYSSVLRLTAQNDDAIRVTPTYITNRSVNVSWNLPVTKVQLLSSDGKIVFEKGLQSASGTMVLSLPQLPSGIYILQVIGNEKVKRERVFIQ
ncbi:PQQ-dependent sugar dehydrogenase [Ferruginibacter sp. HRS2-29]|uniref:PQQ-dependent sugar dehydrogenase n=1 Tax=Ferruginibacter sp. HRS2-29 TaxID=2487334 RepID=UPI0020CCC36E|nr:PQQ-dependent sugar dehydrogenase [Ferruginibacter sp. HRS2-29]MCP9751384.1 T9SS C-terminal target domain-containing protein [Ferruginibacter sp. HRS2-29]